MCLNWLQVIGVYAWSLGFRERCIHLWLFSEQVAKPRESSAVKSSLLLSVGLFFKLHCVDSFLILLK